MKPIKVNFSQEDLAGMVQRRINTMKPPQVPKSTDPLANMKAAIAKKVRI